MQEQISPEIQTKKHGNKFYVYLVAMVAAVGGFLFGYDLAIISSAMIFFKKEFGLDDAQLGTATGAAILGCILGPIFGGMLGDKLGRKKTLIIAALLFGIGAIGTALPKTIEVFSFFRFIGGIGVGLAAVISPMYICEISPAPIRGRLVTINQLAIVVGLSISAFIGYLLAAGGYWRWMFGSNCIPVIALIIGLMFVPESPRWMAQKGQKDKALETLTMIEGPELAEADLNEIMESMKEEKGSMLELFKPGLRIALLIGCALAIFQQVTGVSIMLMYAPVIFQKAGFTLAVDATRQNFIISIWQVVCTVGSLFLVDKIGRRPLLLLGIIGMAVGLGLMGVFFAVDAGGMLVLLTMFICVGAYVMSLAPLAWLIMAEIFPNRHRGQAMGIASLCLWISCFLTAKYFPPLVKYFEDMYKSPAGVFWIFAGVCIVAFIFSWRMVPETKGRSLEEIGKSWTKGRSTEETK